MKSSWIKLDHMLFKIAAFFLALSGPWGFAFGGTSAVLESKLTPTIVSANQLFGDSVAISGNTAVIGAPTMNRHERNGESDIGYVFTRGGGGWTAQGRLTLLVSTASSTDDTSYCGFCHSPRFGPPPFPAPLYNYNFQVALSGDTALVAGGVGPAPGYQVNSSERTGTAWTEQQAIRLASGAVSSTAPIPMAIDGETIALGTTSGVEVRVRSGGTWTFQDDVVPSDMASLTKFGQALALSGDKIAVTGSSGAGNAVYVFVRGGSAWTEEQKIVLPAAAAPVGAWFPVALSGDTLLIGAPDDGGAGAVYVYELSGGSWSQAQKITASDAAAGQAFGFSLAIDGSRIVAGAKTARNAYLFRKSGGAWSEQLILDPPSDAATTNDKFLLSLSGDTLVIGASGDGEIADNAGAAYVYLLQESVDLSLAKTGDVNPAALNGPLTYTLTVANNDAVLDATGVTVTDPLPAGVTFISASTGCTEAGGTVTCVLGTVQKGSTAQATITVRAEAPADIVNTASVSADQNDPDMGNNSASLTTHVNSPPAVSVISDQGTMVNTSVTVTFAVNDAETLPAGLTVTGSSSNTALVPDTPANLTFGGSDENRTLMITPVSNATGTTVITVFVSDGMATATASFILTVLNTPTGTNVIVTPVSGVTVTFSNVTTGGNTYVVISPTLPTPPPTPTGFVFLGTFYDIVTTVSYTGSVTICLSYIDLGMTPEEESALKMLHLKSDGTYTVIPEPDLDRNLGDNILCGTVDSLSWFVIALEKAQDDDPPTFTLNRLKDTLWPPNNKLVKVATVTDVADNADPEPAVDIQVEVRDVRKKERKDGKDEEKDKHKQKSRDRDDDDDADLVKHRLSKDWKVKKKGSVWEVWVRAELPGNARERIYTITVTVTDDTGNQSTDSHTVRVAHDKGKKRSK